MKSVIVIIKKPHPYLKKCYLDLLKMPSRPSKSTLTKKHNHDLDIKNHLSRKVTKPNFLHHTHLNILMIKILTFPSTYQKPIEALNQYQKPLLSLLRSHHTPPSQLLRRGPNLKKEVPHSYISVIFTFFIALVEPLFNQNQPQLPQSLLVNL